MLNLIENLSSLHYDPRLNRLLASFRPSSSPARHELYELVTRPIEDSEQSFIVSLQLIQTFVGSSINIVLSRSKIIQKNFESYIVASNNGSHGVIFDRRDSSCSSWINLDRIMEYPSAIRHTFI